VNDEDFESARQAGVCFYEHPDKLSPEQIDPLLRDIVPRINSSCWVWTAESCQGHPDSTEPVWANNVQPMLRLVTTAQNEGAMLALLMMAARSMEDPSDEAMTAWGRPGAPSFRIYLHPRGPLWVEHLIYVEAATTYSRDRGIECFRRFAEMVSRK